METIAYADLSEESQQKIDTDTDQNFLWFADATGDVHYVRKELEALFYAQGGPDVDWKEVVF